MKVSGEAYTKRLQTFADSTIKLILETKTKEKTVLLNCDYKKALEEFKALLKKYNVEISALSCHGNPVHPNKEIAAAFKEQCGVVIDKKKIQLDEAIKNFGVYKVNII